MPSAPSVMVSAVWADLGDWAQTSGIRIGIIVGIALAAHLIARYVVPRTVQVGLHELAKEIDPLSPEERIKRIDTLSHVFLRTADILIVVVSVFLILGEIGISLAPLIAGAGIAGLAIGFGAQSLVRDFLAGLFVLLEDQFRKGDVVKVAGVTGVVEEFGLRRTVLRDLDGIVHSVPNGEIQVASNFTRGWSRVNLDVSVGYGEDLDRVRSVIDRVGEKLAADPEWGPLITEAPKVLRVNAFEDSGIAIKVLATVQPMKQWDVAGELRRRLKAAFDDEGIEIPFPHRVVVMRSEEPAKEAVHEP